VLLRVEQAPVQQLAIGMFSAVIRDAFLMFGSRGFHRAEFISDTGERKSRDYDDHWSEEGTTLGDSIAVPRIPAFVIATAHASWTSSRTTE
jgi:hypothetical protein